MRILITTSSFPRWEGDATTPFVYLFALNMKKLGNDIHVLAPHFPGAKKFEIVEGMKIHRFQYGWPAKIQALVYGCGVMENLKRCKSLYALVPLIILFQFLNTLVLNFRYKFDLINAHWTLPQGLTTWAAAKLFRIPYAVTVHGGDMYGLTSALFTKLKSIVLSNAGMVLVNSSATYKLCKKLYSKENIVVAPPVFSIKDFSPECYNENIRKQYGINAEFMIFAGRIIEAKGISYLLKAMPKIVQGFPQVKLLIVGEGPDRRNFMDKAKGLDLENNVLFVGWIDNYLLPEYYATADVFVGPSITASYGWKEALGIVFIESLACGTPVVATNVGGITDTIQDGITGLLVEEKNSEDIAKAVIRLLEDRDYARNLAEAGRKHVLNRYNSEVITRNVDLIFRQLAN